MIELRHNTNIREDVAVDEASPGFQLQRARKAAGLDAAAVAAALNISEKYVQALDNNQYERLPLEPFVLGYLRTYAKLVGLAPQAVIDNYRAYRAQLQDDNDLAQDLAAGSGRVPASLQEKLGQHRNAVVLVLLALLVWALLYVVFREDPASGGGSESAAVAASAQNIAAGRTESVQQQASAETEVTANAVLTDGTALTASLAPAQAQVQDDSEEVEVISDDAEPLPSLQERPASAVPALASLNIADSLDSLAFVFTAECWVEVIDAGGDVLATNLYQKGDGLQLQGRAPFNLVLGNVKAVRVQFNGKDVALSPGDNSNRLKTAIGASRR